MSPNQRAAKRIPIGVVGIEIQGICSTGRIRDISATGLRVQDCDISPEIGDHIRVTFVLALDQPGFEVEGCVVRHTEDKGFAIRFEAIEPRLRSILVQLSTKAQELPDL